MKKYWLLSLTFVTCLTVSSKQTELYPAEARLAEILLDGEELEFFDKDSFNYVVNLPYTTTIMPEVSAVAVNPSATVDVQDGLITCTSADGTTQKDYSIHFNVLPKLDLFLAIGQSNMSGRAPYDDAREQMENIWLLTPKGGMEISCNPMNKYSNVRTDLAYQGMGPSYSFSLMLREYLHLDIGMIVNARGGSSLNVWYEPGKECYDATAERIRQAHKWGVFKGIIWHQGSADWNPENDYEIYKQHLAEMVGHLRTELDNDTLWFICGELRPLDYLSEFNKNVIQTVKDYIPYSDYITNEGLTLMEDNTHFDEQSYILMGERYAEKIMEHVYGDRKTSVADITSSDCTDNRIYTLFGAYVGEDFSALSSGLYIRNKKILFKQ